MRVSGVFCFFGFGLAEVQGFRGQAFRIAGRSYRTARLRSGFTVPPNLTGSYRLSGSLLGLSKGSTGVFQAAWLFKPPKAVLFAVWDLDN